MDKFLDSFKAPEFSTQTIIDAKACIDRALNILIDPAKWSRSARAYDAKGIKVSIGSVDAVRWSISSCFALAAVAQSGEEKTDLERIDRTVKAQFTANRTVALVVKEQDKDLIKKYQNLFDTTFKASALDEAQFIVHIVNSDPDVDWEHMIAYLTAAQAVLQHVYDSRK